MDTSYIKKSKGTLRGKCILILWASIALSFFNVPDVTAQSVLFDFDNAPLHTSLPIDLTVNGITAHFTATGQGFSIQDNTSPVVPIGFSGRFIYPNSVYLADLLISFDQTLTDFSILYSCQELGCDDAALMRVTAYMDGSWVGTNTRTATNPGTWPVDTLGCSFTQGFNSVVIHYNSLPPTCQDYGVIFLADNMQVTALTAAAILNPEKNIEVLIRINPVSESTTISFSLLQPENVKVDVYDVTGRLIKNIVDARLNTGEHKIKWNITDNAVEDGVYFLNIHGQNFYRCCKLIVVK